MRETFDGDENNHRMLEKLCDNEGVFNYSSNDFNFITRI